MNKYLILLLLPVFVYSQTPVLDAKFFFEKKQYVQAENLISEYVADHPNDLVSIELLGDAYGHQRKWDDAISNYKLLVKADNNNANYHYKHGGVLAMKALSISKLRAIGYIGDIKRSFLRSAQLDPEHIDARWALVELYIQLPGILGGSKKKSFKYAEELEQLSKVDGYLAKGYVYEYDDEPELAEKYYKKAIDVGGSVTCFEKLTNLYEDQDQPYKAVANIEKAYEKHNKNALHYQIGKVCADYNIQLEKGERCLKNYIKNYTPRDGVPVEWAYFRLAQIYKNKNDKQEALKWIDKALETRVNFKQALKEKQKILAI